MKYEVKAIEEAIANDREWGWKKLGINRTLGDAYLFSREAGNDVPNFNDAIWDEEVEQIVSDCRRLGIKEFTISSNWSGMLKSVGEFVNCGCTLDGYVEVYDRLERWHKDVKVKVLLPALKMTVN